jgi:hypothetical protein
MEESVKTQPIPICNHLFLKKHLKFTQNKVKSGAGSLTFEQLIKLWLQGWFWRYLKPLNLASY